MVESFKEYFGDYEVICEDIKELEKKMDSFFKWRNEEWIVPGENRTPKQLWAEQGNKEVKLRPFKLKGKFPIDEKYFGIIVDAVHGIVIVPYYGYLKEFFEGDYNKVPEHWGFFYNMIAESDAMIPSFVIKNIILKNKDRALEIFKEGYKDLEEFDEIFELLSHYREDWNNSSYPSMRLVDSNKSNKKNGKNNIDFEKEDIPIGIPWESNLINKIFLLVDTGFHDEEEKAIESFNIAYKNEIEIMSSEADINRSFQAWYLLKYQLLNGKTPIEFVFSRGDLEKLFSKKERDMIGNFLGYIESLFEIKKISENKKNFTIENVLDNKEYVIKTIDFPEVLKEGDFIRIIIVKKIEGYYFFFGNVATFSKKEGEKMKKSILKEMNKLKKK